MNADMHARWTEIEAHLRALIRLMLPGNAYPNIEEYLDAREYGLVLHDLAHEVNYPQPPEDDE